MSALQLFEVGPGDVALTSDDWYTPRWLFDAASLTFDLDVCAPVNPAFRTCPARQYLTVVEDGLVQPWHGIVWMNPPYSDAGPWVRRFATHGNGLALVPAVRSLWVGTLALAAERQALVAPDFGRPDGSVETQRTMLILAAIGTEACGALARVAAADRYAAGAYHVRP